MRAARMTMMVALALVALGCETRLNALSVAPPGKVAELNESDEVLEISRGVALAVECHFNGKPCDELEISFDGDQLLARPAFLDDLDPSISGDQPNSVFVVVAKKAGTTTMHVRGVQADADYEVTVLDD